MINTLIEKKIGIKSTIEILKFHTKFPIMDICLFNDKIFFIHDFFIGYVNIKDIDDKNVYWSGRANISNNNSIENASYFNPSSICCSGNNLLIVENGGKQIRKIDINGNFVSSIIKGTDLSIMNNLKDIKNDCKTSITTLDNKIYWCSSSLNMCFEYSDGKTTRYIGNGKYGDIIFNKREDCLLNSPEGILCYKNEIYISDTKNKCIKKTINNGLKVLLTNLNSPKKIKNIYNNIIFIDGNDIKMINKDTSTNISMYNSNDTLYITGNENKLYILESKWKD